MASWLTALMHARRQLRQCGVIGSGALQSAMRQQQQQQPPLAVAVLTRELSGGNTCYGSYGAGLLSKFKSSPVSLNGSASSSTVLGFRAMSTSAWRANQKKPLPVVGYEGGGNARDNKGGRYNNQLQRRGRDDVGRNRENRRPQSDYIAKRLVTRVISVDAVRKTTAGGRVNRFRAIVAAGNGSGAAGFGFGKALTTRAAIAKALAQAKKRWVAIELREDNGLHHDVMGKFNNTQVMMRSCKPFKGLVAGGVVRGICDVFGIQNATTKVLGRTTPSSVIYATFHALAQHKTPTEVQEIRGKKLFRSNRWIF